MSIAIKAENLGKRYIIRHKKESARYETFGESLMQGGRWALGKIKHPFASSAPGSATHEEFWALRDIAFEINRGDRVGIIGRNGAGKSTLLKVLSRITEPTTGKISINGRIASLLEVGTGFHPELTGRENIFLNGAILGMSRKEIREKFDEIVVFAEVEKFLDTPVKRYSSGMYVRLAFAVAAHLEPEILIVDEVLAVGDTQFQKKCLGKMEEVGEAGRTVLFVSHNMSVINALCNKGILLDAGKVASTGKVSSVISDYMQAGHAANGHRFVRGDVAISEEKAYIDEASVLDAERKLSPSIFINKQAYLDIVWKLNVNAPFLRVGFEIIDSMGVVVVSSMDTDSTDLHGRPRKAGVYHETMEIPPFLLMPGTYSVRVFAGIPRIERIMEVEDLLGFEVVDNESHLSHVANSRRAGYIATPLTWEVNFTNA
ncbi:ABC transporter ATP-binding protein [Gammaproteobacteria bacterium]|nr:ABC transporter ATP-binding protein [Gammaproteobacteria bacterium]